MQKGYHLIIEGVQEWMSEVWGVVASYTLVAVGATTRSRKVFLTREDLRLNDIDNIIDAAIADLDGLGKIRANLWVYGCPEDREGDPERLEDFQVLFDTEDPRYDDYTLEFFRYPENFPTTVPDVTYRSVTAYRRRAEPDMQTTLF